MKIIFENMDMKDEDTANVKENVNEFGGEQVILNFQESHAEIDIVLTQDDAFLFYEKLKHVLSKYFKT